MEQNDFYKKYVSLSGDIRKGNCEKETEYKIDYLKHLVNDGKVYKFIGLPEDESIGSRLKLNTLFEKKIWFSYFKELNDETEFQIDYNEDKVSAITGNTPDKIDYIVKILQQIYDVYSVTYAYEHYMWEEYANKGKGICLVFDINDYDMFFPVEYVKKEDINFDEMIINTLNGDLAARSNLSLLPWVLKDKINYSLGIDSTKEKELRILYSPFDEAEIAGGRVSLQIKDKIGHKGISEPYEKVGLHLRDIIIGNKLNKNFKTEIIEFSKDNEIDIIYN